MQLKNMNNISEYIIEKLKLNKDIGKDSLPKKGDLVLSVKHFDYHKQFDISLTYYIVISCDDTTLKCRQDGGVMVKKYKLFNLENRSYKGRFDVFAYADDLTDNNTFEIIIADYDKIMKCLEECKKKGGLEINGYIYDNVVYYDEYQYTSKELIDIFNEESVTEKLHLNKDIKINTEFTKGDKIFCVSIEFYFKKYHIKIYDPFTFLSLKNNELTYNTSYPQDTKNGGKDITRTVFLNSNGYYEMKRNSTTALIMSQTDGINFLEDLLHSNIDVDFLFKYFDKEDEYFNDYPLSYDTINDQRIKNLIDIFNEEQVTEKLHLDKETLSKNHLLNKFTNDISALCGIDINYDKQEIYIKEIDNQLYINNINEKNIDIYCDSKFDLLNRYHEIKYNSDSNKFVDLIKFNPSIFGNIDFDNNNLTLSNYPFKIWSCKDGFVIMYQKFNENYKIYITKKYEESK